MHLENYRPPVRLASWGRDGISFWLRSQGVRRRVGELTFEVGPTGPYAGIVGSPLRRQYEDQVRAWIQTGELPEDVAWAK